MTDEVWKEINGYPNYMISNHGRVKNCMRNKILKPSPRNGYAAVNLCNSGVAVKHNLHKLVGDYFVPNPDSLEMINHIGEDKMNPYYKNLEWVTRKENYEHSSLFSMLLTSPEGKSIVVGNLREFCRNAGISTGDMHRLKTGVYQQYKGWKLR